MRLINADALFPDDVDVYGVPVLEEDEFVITLGKLRRYIRKQPTIDPVKHAYWETYTDYDGYLRHRCSACKENIPVVLVRASTYECPYGLVEEIDTTKYCPSCGSMMWTR